MVEVKFLTEDKRKKLHEALQLVNNILEEINYEYEEYFSLITAKDSLKRAIKAKENYY
ncbi:hypothetical protein [Peribacillus simplex]|uniref:Uncharacterized protein n=1 Tax=Peribacillus simplex TaxID=1478 RepID=A0A9W4KUX0_9BACI|nr:hypothetical protein [Peribacillus simplex]CAH0185577.1 hypothetical protein SRABI133_01535 [Peribacillus simplex]